MFQIFAALKSLSKIVDFVQWLYKTLTLRKAEATHAQNSSDIDAAIDGVSKPADSGSRPETPKAP